MNEFWQKYYKSLEGATIGKFVAVADDEGGKNFFPAYEVRFADGSEGLIEISQDPEGNGGGFIFGLVVPQN